MRERYLVHIVHIVDGTTEKFVGDERGNRIPNGLTRTPIRVVVNPRIKLDILTRVNTIS